MSNEQFSTLKTMPLEKLLKLPKQTIHLFILEYPLLNKFARFSGATK